MKKSLSLILAIAMVFTMFAGIAFADDNATLDTQAKYDALKAKGIFEGTDGGAAALDQPMTRAQFAKTLSVLNGLTEDVAASSVYKDLVGAGWAAGFIGAVTKAKYMDGVEDGKFFPSANVTLEQEATVLVRVFNIPLVNDAVSGKVSNWAKSYVATALKFGLLSAKTDYTAAATRADLVDSTYAAYNIKQVPVKSVKVVDSKNIEVTFSDDKVEKVALTTALENGKETVVPVTHNGFIYAVKVKFETGAISNIAATGAKKITVTFGSAVDTTKATFDVKKGTIPANVNAVTWSEDKKVATLELVSYFTKGDYTVTVGGVVEPAYKQTLTVEDERVTKLEFTSDKAALDRTDKTIVYIPFKLSNQYGEDVTKNRQSAITWSVGKGVASLPDTGKLKLKADATNEFKLDEKVAVSGLYSQDQFSSPVFANVVATVSTASQVASIEAVKVANTTDAKKVLDVNVQSPEDFVVVVNAKDQYGAAVTADMLDEDIIASVTNTQIAGFKSRQINGNTAPDFDKKDVQDVKDQLVLPLAYPTSPAGATKFANGTTTLYLISKATGAKASIDIVVTDKKKADSISLTAPDIAVNGEEVVIPFTATDASGNAVTNASDLQKGNGESFTYLSATGINGDIPIKFVQDYVKNTAKLVLDATNMAFNDKDSTVYISAMTATGKSATLTVTLKANAYAQVVSGIDSVTNVMVDKAATDLKHDKVKVLDQYGRTYDFKTDIDKKQEKFVIGVKNSDSNKVSLGTPGTAINSDFTAQISGANKTVKANALTKGSSTVTFKLFKILNNGTYEEVKNSEYSVNIRVVEPKDIVDFEVGDVAKLWAQDASKISTTQATSDWNKDIKVTGLLSDKTKVGIANGDARLYSVTSTTYGVTYSGGKLSANADALKNAGLLPKDDATKEITVKVGVVGYKADGTQGDYPKTVTISNEVPAAVKLELKSSTSYDPNGTGAIHAIFTKESDGVISLATPNGKDKLTNATYPNPLVNIAENSVKVTDQYGTELKAGKFKDFNGNYTNTVVASNLRDADNKAITKPDGSVYASSEILDAAGKGNSFTLTVGTKNGQVLSYKVVVK